MNSAPATRMRIRASIIGISFALAAAPLQAGVLNVPGDSPTIQGAIAMATSGDTILVAPGTYVETIDLLGKQLVIEGTGGAAVTTIDGNAAGRTVTVDSGEPAGTRLAGFTITGGAGATVGLPDGMSGFFDSNCGGGVFAGGDAQFELADCVISGNTVGSANHARGGGMAVHDAIVTVTGCTFSGNTGTRGAGFCIPAGVGEIAISDCVFTGNTPTSIGAVYLWEGSGTVTDCEFVGNVGTGLHKIGYGVDVRDCSFQGNTGWGYAHYGAGGADVIDLTFLGNGLGGARCLQGQFGSQGGDIITGSVFVNDTLLTGQNDSNTIDRCSFDGATIDLGFSSTVTEMTNTIVRGAGSFTGNGGLQWEYCDIQGLGTGTGNIDADPLWTDAPNGDYSLQPGSPCIDTGDPSSPLDPDGTRADMGAVPFENAFDDLGGGVAGTAGPVTLAAHSTLIGGDDVVFKLSGTTPFKSTLMILGASQLGAPFKGGTMWPALTVLVPGLVTNGSGELTLSSTWPATVPSGFKLWAQFWYGDAGAVFGFAGSNGVRGTVP